MLREGFAGGLLEPVRNGRNALPGCPCGIPDADGFVQVLFDEGQNPSGGSLAFDGNDFFGDDIIRQQGEEPEDMVGLLPAEAGELPEGPPEVVLQSFLFCHRKQAGQERVRSPELPDHGVAGQLFSDVQRRDRLFDAGMAPIAYCFSGAGALPAHLFIHIEALFFAEQLILNEGAKGGRLPVETPFDDLSIDGIEDDGNTESGGKVVEDPLNVVVQDNLKSVLHLHKNTVYCRIVQKFAVGSILFSAFFITM